MNERSAVPDFKLPATGNQRFQLSAFKGHPFIPCFYPKDDTPGCTDEGLQFRDLHAEFASSGRAVFGVSREWRGVMVPGRAREVLDFARSL